MFQVKNPASNSVWGEYAVVKNFQNYKIVQFIA